MTVPKSLSTLAATARGARLVGTDVPIVDLAYDSRAVKPGTLYFCVPGAHTDGHDFAAGAVDAGAVALVVERVLDVAVPQLVVESVRSAMPPIACSFFEDPSRAMSVVGITGTNGKTTTAFMLEGFFRAASMNSGVIGTVETHIGDRVLKAARTTPEAIDLQRLLAQMRADGVRGVAMEASSEGLAFERVEGTWFDCGIFTNLTQDHLNTHGSMDAYFEAKMLMFRPSMCARAVINVDDSYGRALLARSAIPAITFGVETGDADACVSSINMTAAGSTVVASIMGERVEFFVPLPGRYNVANALGVVTAAHALGLELGLVAEAMAGVRVPGRVEKIDVGQDFTVIVDYAHTPDSLEGVLRAAREFTPEGARLTVVFGCGGDRDRLKRPLMGAIGASLSDRAIITSDNPRSEDPSTIIEMIAEGARSTGMPFETVVDRRDAIAAAIAGANAGDVIVIAGKGHESGQQFADRTIEFDDRQVARQVLEAAR